MKFARGNSWHTLHYLIVCFILTAFLVSCGGGGGDNPPSTGSTGGTGGGGGDSISTLNSAGLDLLKSKDITNAKVKFQAAVEAAGTQSSNDADTARFFYALTRVAALGFDLTSDGNSNDLNRAADIFDRFGCSSAGRDPFLWTATCPDTLPGGTPTTGELLTFLQDVVLPELEGATSNLDGVSSSFNKVWTEPISSTTVESDYGDVLFARASLKALRAEILILLSYNLDIDIDAQANDTTSTAEQRLANNPNFFKPTASASAYLPQGRALLQGMVDDLIAAANAIQTETDSQTDDLITLEDMTQADITQGKADLTTFKDALSTATTVDDNETPSDTNDDVVINGDPFFSTVLDLRAMFPPFTGDNPTGFFPDPTFGGVLVQPTNLNDDLNNNSVADIFENGGAAKAKSLTKSLHKDQQKVQTFRDKVLK
ncbi:MAG: hypothetical protein HZA13_02365 [Nitrospirae bacterium]|nr:hypothetical protein [Nitrospirota bacterium]